MQQEDVFFHRLPYMNDQLSLQFQTDSVHHRWLRAYLTEISDIADKPTVAHSNVEKSQSWEDFQKQVYKFYYRHKQQA
jgi:hypothetical protein